jgi:hypothetical protein
MSGFQELEMGFELFILFSNLQHNGNTFEYKILRCLHKLFQKNYNKKGLDVFSVTKI